MADIEPLLQNTGTGEIQTADHEEQASKSTSTKSKTARVASLDVFRGLCVFLMMLVDYAGSIFPIIAHVPWNGVHLADFVMPFFLFVAGVSVAIVYKKVSNRVDATWKAVLRALELFLHGVFLQGGYFHGINSLTYGVDIERIRFLGVLQRIAIGYIVAALCEIWLPCQRCRCDGFPGRYTLHWCVALSLCAIYLGLLYGLFVPDWQFRVVPSLSLVTGNNSHVYTVKCSVRGNLGPACNSAGMIDRNVLGIDHLYAKPVYRNLKECNISSHGQVPETAPSWCHAPFDPEGILSSLTAAVSCIIGLQYGHSLVQLQEHKERLRNWSIFSFAFLGLGLFLAFVGIPINKSLYTISYLLVTSACAGITFCALYTLVDVYGWRWLTCVLEWMGKHSLGIFILVSSNIVVIAVQGFYLKSPEKNIVHWIVSVFVHK
ncbi:heparan-alpha-glucosaminide N-acetyltransferase-like isoform X1 [Olea europaea subsp. europaea]|uniref:Heparan-alpha-glucosaminide N-acetyltransferase-like isoform X1 n=1 Tax=Olea europaea subsp. europaea TaxID=158383 RepID=A0A8S0SF51_OLEEU|nr:heparan-alpha-glucosaminide N-acetyltransferase-like isoform X1 [Olea europaea subsp. europaea]